MRVSPLKPRYNLAKSAGRELHLAEFSVSMPEKATDKTIFSLLEVTRSIQKTLSERYQSTFWVKAEMNKLNHYSQSGHCYPELVEKRDGKVIAQVKACLWREDYLRADSKFRQILKEPLRDGIKILFLAKITFDPAHGLSLWIMDIDPSYTLGDLEREKQETITQLREEGIFAKNQGLSLPMLPQRIAIISVETSKGFADFRKVIDTNPWHYRFVSFLFPSLLQGDKAVDSIIYQLMRIKKVKDHFDVVAIIRGGGGDVGLSCYNNYRLAREIALFPIPVITGIGHATNETVSEMVSFYNAITPTKLAEFLLQKFHNFSIPIQDAEKKIRDWSGRIIDRENTVFQSEIKLFRSVTENVLLVNKSEVRDLSKSLHRHSTYALRSESQVLRAHQSTLVRTGQEFFKNQHNEMRSFAMLIQRNLFSQLSQFRFNMMQLKDKLFIRSRQLTNESKIHLDNLEKNVMNMDPSNVLKRGYSITLFRGKSIRDASEVKEGDEVETKIFNGKLSSIVKSSEPGNNE